MSLSHMESMPLSHPSPQGAQRSSRKLWPFYSAIVLMLSLCSIILIFNFLPLKTAKESCVAKFGPLPSKWQMASPEPPCMKNTSDGKLKILQNALYSIFGEVVFDPNYKGVAPFAVQLRKNAIIIQSLINSSRIQTIGGTYEFHAGDIIDLIFNSEDQVLKNNTYWGIFLVAKPQFIA
ncbi:tumor necrosis factor ligand superfamily member 18 isoform X2 [Castor canadensis]|uniref:Tumor necrosis factor ligand superfamily member 18 n=1 Tax=Castor canadensis TaxID=51338 RepID=A0A8B7TQY1_CASCN|nr:tumor necrosis factor ligand superfamily member 18 [Castor canadensis]